MRHGTHPLAVFLAPRWGVQRRRLPSPHLPFLLMVQWKMTPLERKQVFGETQTTNFHDYGRKSICTFCMQKMSVYKIYYLFNEHFEYTHVTVYIYICSKYVHTYINSIYIYIYIFNIHQTCINSRYKCMRVNLTMYVYVYKIILCQMYVCVHIHIQKI